MTCFPNCGCTATLAGAATATLVPDVKEEIPEALAMVATFVTVTSAFAPVEAVARKSPLMVKVVVPPPSGASLRVNL